MRNVLNYRAIEISYPIIDKNYNFAYSNPSNFMKLMLINHIRWIFHLK